MLVEGQSIFSYRVISPTRSSLDIKITENTNTAVDNILIKFSNFLNNFFGFKDEDINRGLYYKRLNGERLILEVKSDKSENFRRIVLKLRFAGYTEKYSITLLNPFTDINTKVNPDEECIIVVPVILRKSINSGVMRAKTKYYFPRHYPDTIELFYRNLHFTKEIEKREFFHSPYRLGKNYVIPICINLPTRMSGNDFLKNLNEILNLCSLIIAYNFACLRMKIEILKKIANKLFKPWNVTLYRYYQDYHSLKLLVKGNLDGTKDALQSLLLFNEEILDRDSIEQIVEVLKNLEERVSESTPIAENKVEELVELHLFIVSIFIAVIAIAITIAVTILGYTKGMSVLNFAGVLKSSFSSLLRFPKFMEGGA